MQPQTTDTTVHHYCDCTQRLRRYTSVRLPRLYAITTIVNNHSIKTTTTPICERNNRVYLQQPFATIPIVCNHYTVTCHHYDRLGNHCDRILWQYATSTTYTLWQPLQPIYMTTVKEISHCDSTRSLPPDSSTTTVHDYYDCTQPLRSYATSTTVRDHYHDTRPLPSYATRRTVRDPVCNHYDRTLPPQQHATTRTVHDHY